MLPDPFTTARLTFRPLTEADAQPIFDTYAQDREVARYLTWRPHSSVAETEAYVASALAARSRTYLLRDRATGGCTVCSSCANPRCIISAMATFWRGRPGATA